MKHPMSNFMRKRESLSTEFLDLRVDRNPAAIANSYKVRNRTSQFSVGDLYAESEGQIGEFNF